MVNFIKGRDNLSCTIFVPVVCGNNCSFCTSKKDYEGFVYSPEYLNKILSWIYLINTNDLVSEFVISGGEPIMDLDILKEIVNTCEKPVYINTSLPRVKNIYDVIKFINETDKIKGINISRHIGVKHDVAVYGTDIIDMINKPIRINCLINEQNFSIKKIEQMLSKYAVRDNIMLNLRADCRTITDANLKTQDEIFTSLINKYTYLGSSNCLVCNSCHFETEDNKIICYHRGIEQSAVITKNRVYVNDVIINMYGDVFYDWGNPSDNINTDFVTFLLFKDNVKETVDAELFLLDTTNSRVCPIHTEIEPKPKDNPKSKSKSSSSSKSIYSGCGYRQSYHSGCGAGSCGSPGPVTYMGCGVYRRSYGGCGTSGC